jgi:hypothetical protein
MTIAEKSPVLAPDVKHRTDHCMGNGLHWQLITSRAHKSKIFKDIQIEYTR